MIGDHFNQPGFGRRFYWLLCRWEWLNEPKTRNSNSADSAHGREALVLVFDYSHGYCVMYRKMSRVSSSVSVARTLICRRIVAIIRGGNFSGAM